MKRVASRKQTNETRRKRVKNNPRLKDQNPTNEMNQIIESLRSQDKDRFAAFRRSNIQARALSEFITFGLANKYMIRESNEVYSLSKYVSTKAEASITSAVQIASKTYIQRIIKLAKVIQRSASTSTEIPLSPQSILSAFQAITLPSFVVASENRED